MFGCYDFTCASFVVKTRSEAWSPLIASLRARASIPTTDAVRRCTGLLLCCAHVPRFSAPTALLVPSLPLRWLAQGNLHQVGEGGGPVLGQNHVHPHRGLQEQAGRGAGLLVSCFFLCSSCLFCFPLVLRVLVLVIL